VSIEGPSSSGKTTLLSILGLLHTATIRSGASPSSPSAPGSAHCQIGLIFQSFNFIGDLDVFENVELPLTYRSLPAAERRTRVEAALARVRMTQRTHDMPTQLSGGLQQRVAVARAVAVEPLVILADKPTGNLDSKNGDAMMALPRELNVAGAAI
jgi:putative ABC transport system ATP-binding protein